MRVCCTFAVSAMVVPLLLFKNTDDAQWSGTVER